MCNKLCKNQRIILDGKEIILRNPRMSDAKSLLEFINSLVEEGALILANKKFTLKEEREWLKGKIKSVKKNQLHLTLATYKNETVGNVEIIKDKWRRSHVATIGISIKRNYRGIGLGKLLIKRAIELAKRDPKIKILQLSVFEPNKLAKRLYEKVGFKTVAVLPKQGLYKGKYVDEYWMYYPLKKI